MKKSTKRPFYDLGVDAARHPEKYPHLVNPHLLLPYAHGSELDALIPLERRFFYLGFKMETSLQTIKEYENRFRKSRVFKRPSTINAQLYYNAKQFVAKNKGSIPRKLPEGRQELVYLGRRKRPQQYGNKKKPAQQRTRIP